MTSDNIQRVNALVTIGFLHLHLRSCPQTNFEPLRASQIDKVSNMLKSKLLNDDQGIARSYLHLLVTEIKVTNDQALVSGCTRAMITASELATNKNGHLKQVPTSVSNWGG